MPKHSHSDHSAPYALQTGPATDWANSRAGERTTTRDIIHVGASLQSVLTFDTMAIRTSLFGARPSQILTT